MTFSKAVYFLIYKEAILSFKYHIIFWEWGIVHSKKNTTNFKYGSSLQKRQVKANNHNLVFLQVEHMVKFIGN